MRLNKTTLLLATALFSTLSVQVQAEEQGEIRMKHGATVQQNVTLHGENIGTGNNKPGNEFTVQFPDTSAYTGVAYCRTADIKASSLSYRTEIQNLPGSDINPGFYKLNEYFDVKVAVNIGGRVNSEKIVPFSDVDNDDPDYDCLKNSGTADLVKMFATGSRGRVIFKLRKSIDGYASAGSPGTVTLLGRMTNGGRYGTEPLFQININTSIDALPEKCTFNNGAPLDVDFGSIGTEGLDGSKYVQQLNVDFRCEGGSFDSGDRPVHLSLRGKSADGETFQTSLGGLGIRVTEKGKVIKPNEKYPVNSPGNRGRWLLETAPVARPGAALKEGEFTASATLMASFE